MIIDVSSEYISEKIYHFTLGRDYANYLAGEIEEATIFIRH